MRKCWIILAALLAGGCAHQATYDATHLQEARRPVAQKADGKVLVVTTNEDDAFVFTGNPTSLTGAATTLTMPLGTITRESALAAFADAFRDGADAAADAKKRDGYRVVVSPKVMSYSYEYNQLKNLGFAITPTVRVSLRVRVLDAGGQTAWERMYESGDAEGPSWMINTGVTESMSKLTHKTVYDLLVKSAADISADVLKQGR